ncbi:tRNA1(Val) (adenine(37)-N6)-methyltransferase [Ferrimonas marina]|uniref:tRNA1(Val) (adenine(37)-N6)-methyltransferase n=1 Tax=Ferrimonas marina TaxID=299255 RepID=A0A1M5VTU0_9GAMM|nr:methyltransferase [Ferrimonas marina]SHH78682.1 tRNA1Val (adenine37-N6)-methyltransferase [Ferrimonas marina]
MPFTFKQFHVDDRLCGMPVSTDSVLLGAWSALPTTGRVLDIGTGSGLLALMAAQRSNASITAVELDPQAARQAQANFAASPWADRLSLVVGAIQSWQPDWQADAIVCNPPYFSSGLRSEKGTARAQARHHDQLSLAELAQNLDRLLAPAGQASLILPAEEAALLIQHCAALDLPLAHRCQVRTTPRKPVQRTLLLFSRRADHCVQDELLIQGPDGRYSDAYCQLTQAFYLKMGSQTQ